MIELAFKIFEFCDKKIESVSREPKDDIERGFKTAVMLQMTALKLLVQRELLKDKEKMDEYLSTSKVYTLEELKQKLSEES